MDPQNLSLADTLAQGEALFTLLGRIFHGVPDRELFARAADERIFDEIPFVPAEAEEVARAREHLARWTDGCAVPFSDEDFEAVCVEYTRLFVGTRTVLAPVWESVYFNRDRMVFQHQTFDARRAYARYGLEVDNLSHEPDDHLAYELLFIARLFAVARERLAEAGGEAAAVEGALDGAQGMGVPSTVREVLHDLVDFAQRHPLMWVPMWCPLVVEKTESEFYRGHALLVLAALKHIEASAPAWGVQA